MEERTPEPEINKKEELLLISELARIHYDETLLLLTVCPLVAMRITASLSVTMVADNTASI